MSDTEKIMFLRHNLVSLRSMCLSLLYNCPDPLRKYMTDAVDLAAAIDQIDESFRITQPSHDD